MISARFCAYGVKFIFGWVSVWLIHRTSLRMHRLVAVSCAMLPFGEHVALAAMFASPALKAIAKVNPFASG